jgi:hypothetical protein
VPDAKQGLFRIVFSRSRRILRKYGGSVAIFSQIHQTDIFPRDSENKYRAAFHFT